MTKHPSHDTRSSDASTFDEVCEKCGATDITGGGWGKLAEPCPMTPEVIRHIRRERQQERAGEEYPPPPDPDKLIDKLASALEHTLNFAPAVKRRKEQHDYLINLIHQARTTLKTGITL